MSYEIDERIITLPQKAFDHMMHACDNPSAESVEKIRELLCKPSILDAGHEKNS
jgi:uncharacterized protein (DUF1778 family)